MSGVNEQNGVASVKSTAEKEAPNDQTLTGKVVNSDLKNILNKYRSVNYHFTIAALTQENVQYPQSYRGKPLPYVVASTKGKGPNAISNNIKAIVEDLVVTEKTYGDFGEDIEKKKVVGQSYDYSGKAVVEGFNKNSPGKFEFFIDDVEIDSIVAPNEETGTSLSTAIRFNVTEPYSVNGFIEALHTSALAAGWSGYLNAAYLLVIDFVGYPDNADLPNPETINATKYIPIRLVGSEMSVTEQGTQYYCKAIPFNEAGYGNPNKIYTDISFTGNTVKQVIDNLFLAINKNLEDRVSKEQIIESASFVRDVYEVYFPKTPEIGKDPDILSNEQGNQISASKINEHLKENSLYKFPETVETAPKPAGGGRGSYQADQLQRNNPQVARIQFTKDSQITEIISAVIRDSQYLQGILEDIENAKDTNGMIDYFQIVINTIPLGVDVATNIHRYKYQFIVIPYKVHYTKIPGQQTKQFPAKELAPLVRRTYNYIYTGKNIDVLNFKLNFNNLFFQAANPKMGSTDQLEVANSAAPSGITNPRLPAQLSSDAPKNQTDVAPISPYANSSSYGDRAGAQRSDPYFQLAYNTHRAILESVNLLVAEMDIVGDPFYISTSGQGNYFAGIKQLGLTNDGEANPVFGPIMIRINFRNPVDINPVTGKYDYSSMIPFSGVYMITKVKHIFRNGEFKQTLKMLRFNGQIDDPLDQEKPDTNFVETPKPGEQARKDTTPAGVPKQGSKPNEINLEKMINRGFPTAAGIQGPETSTFNKIAKAAFGVGAVLAGADLLKGGLKLDVKTLAGMAAVGVGASSLLNQAGAVAGSILPGSASSVLNSEVVKSSNLVANNITNAANNLGTGVKVPTVEGIKTSFGLSITDGSGNPILSGSALSDPAGAVSGVANKIGNFSAPSVPGLSAAQRNAVVADAKAKGIPVDQALRNAEMFGVNLPGVEPSYGSFAAKLGIDPKNLSGLTGGLVDSKLVDQIKQAAEEIPKNTNLEEVKKRGVVMETLSVDAFKNLPGIPPELKAPLAKLPSRSVASTLTPEQRSAVIADAKAKGIPVDQALRNASMFGINVSGLTPEAQAIAISNNPQAYAGNMQALSALGITGADLSSGKLESISKQLNSLNPQTASLSDITAGLTGAASAIGGPFSGLASAFKQGPSSVEGLQSNIQSALGNPGTNLSFADMSKSVAAKFGSLSSSVGTPLNKLMNSAVNKLNDPKAPPYTGTDPIVRARLGLPPAVDEFGNEIT